MQDDETPPAGVKRRWRRAAELLGLVRQEDSTVSGPTPWWASIVACFFGSAVAVTFWRWVARRDPIFDGSWLVWVAVLTVVVVTASRWDEGRERRRSAGGSDRES